MNIQTIAPATDANLALSLRGLEQKLYQAADAQVALVEGNFTAVERMAMREGEALRMTNGIDLAVVLLRGSIISKIVTGNLASQHPNQYGSLREMAIDCGVSHSELSKTQNLVEIVFPRLVELGYSVPELWEKIGKSKFNELVPYFRVIMTGEASESDIVNDSVEQLRNDVAATAAVANVEMTAEDIDVQIIDNLVDDAINLPTRELRQSVRREQRDPMPITFISSPSSDTTFLIAELNPDQRSLFERQFGDYADQQNFMLPEDPIAAALEAAQVPAIIRIADLLTTR